MKTISACLILRDNETNINDLLTSLQKCKQVKQIICVMDERSQDNTLQIIKRWQTTQPQINIELYSYGWKTNSFADARNYSLTFAREELILIIDGDETLEALEILEEGNYYWTIIDNFGRATLHTRLFQNKLGIYYKWKRHETIEHCFKELNLKPGKANIIIKNNTQLTEEQAIQKVKSLLQAHFEQIKEEPENFTLNYHISECYQTLEDFRQCLDFSFSALLFDPIRNDTKARICINIYNCFRKLAKIEHNYNYEYHCFKYLDLSADLVPEQLTAYVLMYENAKHKKNTAMMNYYKEIILNTTVSKLPLDITYNHLKQLNIFEEGIQNDKS